LNNLAFDSLDVEEASRLELLFEEREVFEVVKGMNRDKASDRDRFSMAFFQDCWDMTLWEFSLTSMLVVSLKKALMPP
jgi:hypothetical protein